MQHRMLRRIRTMVSMFILFAALGCGGGVGSAPRNNNPSDPSNSPGQSNAGGPISIFPASETLRIGGQRQFSGWDSTVGQYDVTWSLQEGAAAGTVTTEGLYTAPSTPGTFHLIATSSHNTSLSATGPVTVVSAGFIFVSDMAIARSGHTAILLADGRVLAAGATTGAEIYK